MRVFLSLGSNLGNRRGHLEQALREFETRGLRVVARSPVYETEPWPEEPLKPQQWYLNCAVAIETTLKPRSLLRLLHDIEAATGRTRVVTLPQQYPERTLDIDILLYGSHIVSNFDIQIPHPLLHLRRFVLMPLADIAPDVEHPTLYQSIRELLSEAEDERAVFRHGP